MFHHIRAAATGAALLLAPPAQALTIEVQLDGAFDESVAAPFAGTGVFETSADLTDGIYDLFALPDVSQVFDFGTMAFTLADLVTASTIEILIGPRPARATSASTAAGTDPMAGRWTSWTSTETS